MNIKNVSLTICAENGQRLEVPLEVWQVDIITQMLGLNVDTSTLASYEMSSKESVDERMKIYHDALKHQNRQSRSQDVDR